MTALTKPPGPSRLPLGFTVELGRLVRVRDGGRTLVGGAPTRVLYLKDAARALLTARTLTVTNAASRALADRLLEAGMADPVVDSLPPADENLLSYVVPVRDRPEALERLLVSIGPGRTVIVVDDCSEHPEAVARVATAHGAKLIALPVNVGPGGARNAGLAEVETEFVTFVDSDIEIEPGAMALLLRHFADERVAVASPRVLARRDPRGAGWIARYEEARSSLDLGEYPAIVRPRAPVSWVPSACLLARVSAIGDGFAAELRVGEDVDLVWRLAEQGWRVRYEPAAEVRHEHRVQVADWMLRKAVYGTGSFELARRHPGDIAPAILSPWSAALVVAVLAQRRWTVPVVAALMIVTAGRISRKVTSSDHPYRLSVSLTVSGALASLSQAVALIVRHWWPLTVLGCIVSTRMRRATLAAVIVDGVVEYLRTGRSSTGTSLDPFRFSVARRLDDLAYGGGVWFSAVRGRSLRALLPDVGSAKWFRRAGSKRHI